MDQFFEDSRPVLNELVLLSFRSVRKLLSSDFFRSYDGFWDFFYACDGIFHGRNGQFGEVRAHSILQLRWKSHFRYKSSILNNQVDHKLVIYNVIAV